MKKMKNLILCLFTGLLALTVTVRGQKVSPRVLSGYPASVIVKVFNVTGKVSLNDEKQMKLAALFQREDSLLSVAIKNGAKASVLEEMKHQSSDELQNLLTPAELHKLYTANAAELAQPLATAEAAAISKNTGADPQHEKFLYKTYWSKYLEIGRISQQYQFDSTLTSRMQSAIAHFDTISRGQITSFRIKDYYNKNIAFLDSVKPLGKAQKAQIERVFATLCIKDRGENLEQNFKAALQNTLKDTLYYRALYASDINRRAGYTSKRQVGKYMLEYKLGKDSRERLSPLFFEKEKRLAVIDHAYPLYTPLKDSMIYYTTLHFDSLIIRALCYDGINAPDNWFFRILRDKKRFGLTAAQVDTLAEKGFQAEYNKKAKADGRKDYENFDIRKFERENVPVILSEEQYLRFLTAQNKEEAAKYTLINWYEIKQHGWVQPEDSARVYKQIESYNLARGIAIDRYRHDIVTRRQNLDAIDLSIPPVMQKLRAANKRAKFAASADKKDNDGKTEQGTFQW